MEKDWRDALSDDECNAIDAEIKQRKCVRAFWYLYPPADQNPELMRRFGELLNKIGEKKDAIGENLPSDS